jgi:predicted nucleic acid-binding protein
MRDHRDEAVIDVVVLGEIWRGIDKLPPGKRRNKLLVWFDDLRQATACLSWTPKTAIAWGAMLNRIQRQGFVVATIDTMIAANAVRHGLVVATRNVSDFTRCGVPVFNPFDE